MNGKIPSLRTLLLAVALFGAGVLLYVHWEPWVPDYMFSAPNGAYDHDVTLSPNGERLVTASDRELRLWDVASGRVLATFAGRPTQHPIGISFSPGGTWIHYHTGRVLRYDPACGAFDPPIEADRIEFAGDGHLMVAFGPQRGIQLLDTATGQPHLALYPPPDYKRVHYFYPFCSFSPDGSRLLCQGLDDVAILWDTTSGRKVQTLSGHPNGVKRALFEQNGQRVFSYGIDTARAWDTRSGNFLFEFKGHAKPDGDSSSIRNARVTPDNKYILLPQSDAVRVFDGKSGELLAEWLFPQEHCLRSLPWASNNRWIALAVTDAVEIREIPSGKLMHRFPLETQTHLHNSGYLVPELLCEGRRMVGIDYANLIVYLWDLESGNELLRDCDVANYNRSVFDSRGIVLVRENNEVALVDAETGARLLIRQPTEESVVAGLFPERSVIVLAVGPGVVEFYDLRDGELLCTAKGRSKPVRRFLFPPDERRLITVFEDGWAQSWRRQRPEIWWGAMVLPEFWVVLLLCPVLLWSAWCCREGVLQDRPASQAQPQGSKRRLCVPGMVK